MVQFTCRRCGYNATQKVNILKHLRRKKPCVVTLEDISQKTLLDEIQAPRPDANHVCNFCDKRFVERRNKNNHESKCAKKTQYVKDLEDEVKRLRGHSNGSKNNGIVVNHSGEGDVNMIVINVNPVDKPNLSKLTTEKVLTLTAKKDPIARLTKHVYFDKKVPENHSIYAPSMNTNDLKMHNGKILRKVRYPDKAIKKVIKIIVNNALDRINENYDQYRDIIEYENDLDDKEEVDQIETELVETLNSALDDPKLTEKCMKIFHDNHHIIKTT